MGKPALKVQTPGAQPEAEPQMSSDDQSQSPGDADEALVSGAADLDMPKADKPQPELPPDLAALVAKEVARQVGAQKAADAAAKAVPGKATPLPRYDDVVATNPAKPVLTDAGWYVPAGYGAIPNAPKV